MPGEDLYSWSVTAANNGNSDSAIEWREGQTRASVNNSSRAEMAAHAKDRNLKNGSISTTNTANAYAFTSGVTYTTVPTGLRVKLKIGTTTNTGTSTLNMDGIGDVTIKDDQGLELRGGELVANAYTDFLYDGSNWIFLYSHAFFFDLITNGDGIIIATQVFNTPGAFTYTPSAPEVQCAIVECIGAGGGGGAAWSTLANTLFQGGGGGGGGYSRKTVTKAQIGVSQAITVGTGGIGGASGPGGAGTASSFGTLCIANGASGGNWGNFDTNPDAGAGGAPGTGDIAIAGSPGHFGWFSRTIMDSYTMSGNGAPGPLGGGSFSPTLAGGVAGTGYGAGGAGGSMYNGGGLRAGGAGAGGLVIVTEFGGRGSPGRDGNDGAAGPTGPMGPAGPAGAGTGDVLRSGTPVVGQMAQWTSTSQIRGVDVATDFGTGDIKSTFKVTPDTGWVMLDDRTIGSASSSATNRANADTLNLYTLLWNNVSDADAPVSSGRGASAAADFAANKTLTLPKALGRAMMSAGTGASLTTRALGVALGAEAHVMTIAEMPSHDHTYYDYNQTYMPNSISGDVNYGLAGSTTGPIVWNGPAAPININSDYHLTQGAGGGAGMSLLQPSFAVNFMCKL